VKAHRALLRLNSLLLWQNIKLRRTISRLHRLRLEELRRGVRVACAPRAPLLCIAPPSNKEQL